MYIVSIKLSCILLDIYCCYSIFQIGAYDNAPLSEHNTFVVVVVVVVVPLFCSNIWQASEQNKMKLLQYAHLTCCVVQESPERP